MNRSSNNNNSSSSHRGSYSSSSSNDRYQSRDNNNHHQSNGNGNGYQNGRSHGGSSENGYQRRPQNSNSYGQNGSGPNQHHSMLNKQAQKNKMEEINNLPRPNWSAANLKPFEKRFYQESSHVMNRPMYETSNFLQKNNITVSGSRPVNPVLNFNEVDVPNQIMDKIYDLKYQNPTPIQSMCWPALLAGHDLVGIAQTGSGKTFGFVLPMLIHIMNNNRYMRSFGRDETPGPIGLVVAPTRELAIQIQQVADEFSNQMGIKNIVIYGGSPKQAQLQQINRGAEIYIATPGRLIDFVKDNLISLHRCTFLVLDEADRMLDMGFEPQIRKIIEQIRPDRQTAMFSATWPKEVRKLAEDFISDYTTVNIGAGELTANPNIRQIVEVCQEYEKENRLREVLNQIMNNRDSKAIVFAETKKKVDNYSKFIQNMGFYCLTIHGDKKQNEREWVLNEFKKKPKSILCATDVAARGLNISDIKFVINVDYPMQTEDYIHRIGRTARSSNSGTSFTFLTSDNARHVPKLIEILKEANQFVHEDLMNLARNVPNGNGFKNGRNGQYQKPKYNNGNFNNNDNFNNNGNNGNYNQDSYGNKPMAYKRNASDMSNDQNSSNGYQNSRGGDENQVKRVRRNRWDDGDSNNVESTPLPNVNNFSNGNRNMSAPQFNAPMPLMAPPPPPVSAPTVVPPVPQPLLAAAMYPGFGNFY